MRTIFLAMGAMLASTACAANPTEGSDDRASFSYDSLGSMSIPLAAGASDGIAIGAPSGTTIARAASSDSSVLALGDLKAGSSPGSYDVPVTAGNPGSATLTIYDASGNEIDHTTVQVAPTATIPLSFPDGATLLAGGYFSLHATTVGADGQTLAGTGAIHFAYTGGLVPTTSAAGLCSGDCGDFQASSPGDGEIDVTATSARAVVQVHVVDPSALDSLSFASSAVQVKPNDGTNLDYTLRAGGAIVYDGGVVRCTSTDPQVAQPYMLGADPGYKATGVLMVTSSTAGTATITCSAGQKQATLNVVVK